MHIYLESAAILFASMNYYYLGECHALFHLYFLSQSAKNGKRAK